MDCKRHLMEPEKDPSPKTAHAITTIYKTELAL